MIPIIVLSGIEGLLPVDTFTHRPWEALLFKSHEDMFFYPNQRLQTQSVGDLCHHTKFKIRKNETWITDKLGFRNDRFIKKADVLLVGDSFTVGSSITQDSTLTNLLKKKLNKEVYNIAPANFSTFKGLLNQNVFDKPKTLIFSINERIIPSQISELHKNHEKALTSVSSYSIFLDKINRFYSLKYLNSRISGNKGRGIRGKVDSAMFFLTKNQPISFNEKIFDVHRTILSYKKFCDSIGVEFIFLPIPVKETVYYDKIPLKKQPDYLLKLDSLLVKSGIQRINTLQIFNNYRESTSNANLLYHLDDTHWNSTGVNLIAEKMVDMIRKN